MTKKKDIVFSMLPDGEGVLLNLKTKRFYTLNSTGAEIWKHYEEGKDIDEIAKALQEKYDIDPERAKNSVKNFFSELVEYKLI